MDHLSATLQAPASPPTPTYSLESIANQETQMCDPFIDAKASHIPASNQNIPCILYIIAAELACNRAVDTPIAKLNSYKPMKHGDTC